MIRKSIQNVAVIVAHPDDETLWCGGTLLSHPSWKCFVVCGSRRSDAERATKFHKALEILGSEGIMGDLDDGPDQKPLDEKELQRSILELMPKKHFDLIISHSPMGEYTRHKRHEEIGKAVIKLWHTGKISANELWSFAYQDGNKAFYPLAVANADVFHTLSKRIWGRKYSLIHEVYGFDKNSWEAETTPKAEAFWQFTDPAEAKRWLARLKT
jgi:LmbE family N-acetylglucosaminyl deacetylase